ncbi:unnamed protein product [Lymnaea stagnalis]|uniref:DUF4795 domain-containing protein n=1 Tax=Lymnaea stagnalis TaxID=6523 RepID=A0AAV2HF15_LYMST
MPTSVSLSHLVDLALGSPEVGAVNFNVLHTLLHAMIQRLNIQDVKADIDEHDRELLSTHAAPPRSVSAFSTISKDSGKGDDSFSIPEESSSDKYNVYKRSPYHQLEKQVAELTKQMDELNKLPSNQQLLNRTKGIESERPVSDMWQSLQLKKRVDANEEGISKLVSLFEDMMKEMKELRDGQADLMEKIKSMNLDEINERLKNLDQNLKDINDKYAALADKISHLPGFNDLEQYLTQFVTWPGLEDALKGVRQDFENLQPVTEQRVVIELGTQTATPEPKSRPPSARAVSRASSALSSGPSNELLDLLERLGSLSTAHDELKKRVDELEKLLQLKADKDDLRGIGTSQDTLTAIKKLQEELDNLKETQIKDEDDIRRLQEALQKHQVDVDQLQESLRAVIEENSQRAKEIQDLLVYCDNLNNGKADKEYVDMEVNVKADRRQLEGKVNHSLFDSTTSEINRMIKDILDKLNGHDGDWKNALAKAMEELDGKLDRRELNNLRDWLEQQLKALNNKIKSMGPGWQLDDEAAGMKKQLIQRFHCLSCDKPIDVMPHGPIPSIPANYGLPRTKSPRPYTVFELDQIRQHARSLAVPQEGLDYYATIRQCGGSHTLTQPHKRTTRLNNLGQLFRDDETIIPLYKEEMDVQGADGQVYKGRIGSILPSSVSGQPNQPSYMEQHYPLPSQPSNLIPSEQKSRPRSARVTSTHSGRPTSAHSGRPMSSRSGHRNSKVPGSERNESVIAPENSLDGRRNSPQPDENADETEKNE